MSPVDDTADSTPGDRPRVERNRRFRRSLSTRERDTARSVGRRPPVPVVVATVVIVAVVVAAALGLPVLRGRAAADALPPVARQIAQAAPLPVPTPTPAPEASPSETPSGDTPAEVTFEVYSVRDPFAQLVTLPAAEGDAGAAGGSDTTGTGTGTPTTGTGAGTTTTGPGASATPTPSPSPGSSTGSGGGGSSGSTPSPGASPTAGPSELGATAVELVDTFVEDGADKALVSVNGRGYEVAEGQAFATDFTLVAVDAPCVTLTYETRQFLLCEGDEILK